MGKNITTQKKIGCSIAVAISALLIIFAFCGRFFNSWLKDVANFFVGCFGMAFYGLMIAVIVCCSFLLAGKTIKIPSKYIAHFCMLFVEIVLLVHMFTTVFLCYGDGSIIPFGEYASLVYNYYSGVPTFGGIVFGTIVYGLQRVITIYGASVVLFGLLAWSVIVTGDFFFSYFTGKIALSKPVQKNSPADLVPSSTTKQEEHIEDERERAIKILFSGNESSLAGEDVTTSEVYKTADQSTLNKKSDVSKPSAEEILFPRSAPQMQEPSSGFFRQTKQNSVEDDDFPNDDEIGVKGFFTPQTQQEEQPKTTTSTDGDWRATSHESGYDRKKPVVTEGEWIIPKQEEPATKQEPVVEQKSEESETYSPVREEVDVTDVFVEQTLPVETASEEDNSEPPKDKPVTVDEKDDEKELVPVDKVTPVPGGMQVGYDFHTKEEIRKAEEKIHKYPKYVTPPLDLLNEATVVAEDDSEYREKAAQAIVNKLAVFGIKIESAGQVVGPTVTRYLFSVTSLKTRMSDFKQYSADIKACLEAQDEIRIEAPVQGTNLVGIEVANKVRTPVMLRTLLESKEFREKKGELVFVIGQEISGEMIIADLAKLPHLLVAGTTGSGKSVFLNTMIVSMMYRYGPEYLRFVMVDPKFVELSRYNGIPHMLTSETITVANDALAGMDYLISEMESRYQLFRQNGVANITEYNAKINPKITQRLPYLVLVVDELADLMTVCQKNFEAKLQRLAQKSRAAGIHIVLATQRPDVKTITGTIKTNLPCRVAFKVSSPQDSITILNVGGAEKLLGYGDMLYMNPSKSGLLRAQGALIENEEISELVQYICAQNEVYYDEKISQEIFVSKQQPQQEPEQDESGDDKDEKLDPYCKKALRFWLERQGGRASIASIQRSLKIGFNRAGRIMDSLQKLHYVEELASNETSTKPVRVLVSLEDLDNLFPDMED